MKLKLDENLGHRIAEFFRAVEHDAVTVKGQGLAGHPDRRIFEEYQQGGRVTMAKLPWTPWRLMNSDGRRLCD
jgi:predicted nuclease of predicted toxin-antitoxin system